LAGLNITDYVSIIISVSAFFFSLISFYKSQKSDQFRIAMDLIHKLEEIRDKRFDDSREKVVSDSIAAEYPIESMGEKLHRAMVSGYMDAANQNLSKQHLDTLELISFLINSK
jgi:hypothetical protein